jgi:hypothetical protein
MAPIRMKAIREPPHSYRRLHYLLCIGLPLGCPSGPREGHPVADLYQVALQTKQLVSKVARLPVDTQCP